MVKLKSNYLFINTCKKRDYSRQQLFITLFTRCCFQQKFNFFFTWISPSMISMSYQGLWCLWFSSWLIYYKIITFYNCDVSLLKKNFVRWSQVDKYGSVYAHITWFSTTLVYLRDRYDHASSTWDIKMSAHTVWNKNI